MPRVFHVFRELRCFLTAPLDCGAASVASLPCFGPVRLTGRTPPRHNIGEEKWVSILGTVLESGDSVAAYSPQIVHQESRLDGVCSRRLQAALRELGQALRGPDGDGKGQEEGR